MIKGAKRFANFTIWMEKIREISSWRSEIIFKKKV